MENQKLKFQRTSKVSFDGKSFDIEVWKDANTQKLWIIDYYTGQKLDLGDRIGKEIR